MPKVTREERILNDIKNNLKDSLSALMDVQDDLEAIRSVARFSNQEDIMIAYEILNKLFKADIVDDIYAAIEFIEEGMDTSTFVSYNTN